MLPHLILAICQIVIACIMIGALIVFCVAVREASLSLSDWLQVTAQRRRQYKIDRRQSHQFKEFHDGPKHP